LQNMPTPEERSERFDLNPRNIRPEAVQAVIGDLLGLQPVRYVQALSEKRLGGTPFAELLDPEFQAFRIGVLGFELPVEPEDQARYAINLSSLSTIGPEDIEASEDIGWDSIESINTMRAFVGSAFFEEANRQRLPNPAINSSMIDPFPAKKSQIVGAVASRPGMFLYEWEDLEKNWQQENFPLFEATTQLRDQLTYYYTGRMIQAYGGLPADYLAMKKPEIALLYRDYLMEYGLRTYAMLTPHPPLLVEIKGSASYN
jgi:hypothetical protein